MVQQYQHEHFCSHCRGGIRKRLVQCVYTVAVSSLVSRPSPRCRPSEQRVSHCVNPILRCHATLDCNCAGTQRIQHGGGAPAACERMYISGPDGGGDAVRGAILASGIAAAAVGGKDRFGESAFHGTSSVGRRMRDSVHYFAMQCIMSFFSIYTIIYRDLFVRVQGNEGGLGYPSREVVCTLLGAQREIADSLQGDQYTRACLVEAQARLHLARVVHGGLAREKLFNSKRTDTNGEGRNGKRRRVSTPMNMCNTAYMAATRMTNTHLPRAGQRRAPS